MLRKKILKKLFKLPVTVFVTTELGETYAFGRFFASNSKKISK